MEECSLQVQLQEVRAPLHPVMLMARVVLLKPHLMVGFICWIPA